MRTQLLLIILLALTAPVALAGDGRLELNQAAVDAAGGFPYAIGEPGNYVLTGSLVVPADTDGFVLSTSGVVFDLNGFSISGPVVCSAGSCSVGSGMAIRGFSGTGHAHDTTVRNGFIRGFGNNCLRLGSGSYVTELRVSDCGRSGISVAHGSLVTHNRVSRTGERGISLAGTTAAYGHNTVLDADLAGGDFGAISGGRATDGNLCDDGSCSATRLRKYYLTEEAYTGNETLSACSAGFHFAAFREILQPTVLLYASELGRTAADSGSGPPQTGGGWVRTGNHASGSTTPGVANCEAWTSSQLDENGTWAILRTFWAPTAPTGIEPHWDVGVIDCDAAIGVWCVED